VVPPVEPVLPVAPLEVAPLALVLPLVLPLEVVPLLDVVPLPLDPPLEWPHQLATASWPRPHESQLSHAKIWPSLVRYRHRLSALQIW
jgi:hypothetical protein